jgi:hypothetical protein
MATKSDLQAVKVDICALDAKIDKFETKLLLQLAGQKHALVKWMS